jgi:hypothetical protein
VAIDPDDGRTGTLHLTGPELERLELGGWLD